MNAQAEKVAKIIAANSSNTYRNLKHKTAALELPFFYSVSLKLKRFSHYRSHQIWLALRYPQVKKHLFLRFLTKKIR